MNIKVISRNVGFALLVSALFMFLSMIISIVDGMDSAFTPLAISCLITFLVGSFPFIFVRQGEAISVRDGYLIIVLSWLLSFIFGMLPYVLWGGEFNIVNAWFESVSGYTTTGATILNDIEALPRSLLFWRSSTHFIGGLGVVVFLLLILPHASPFRLRLTNIEMSSLSREGYRIRSTKIVSVITCIYLGLAVLAIGSFLLAGMPFFDAVNHGFSVVSTGGFSIKNASISAYDSVAINIIVVVFVLISSVHFGLIFTSLASHSLKPIFKSSIVRYYFTSIIVMILIVALSLKLNGGYESWGLAALHSMYEVVCCVTTAGFGMVDNSSWPFMACVVLMIASMQCACSGSTSGGIKADRIYVAFRTIARQVKQVLHPSSIFQIRVGKQYISDSDALPVMMYIVLYCVLIILGVFGLLMCGENAVEAISGAVASVGNVGPGLGEIGSMGSYAARPMAAKLIYTGGMFLGRLEIYPIFVIFYLIFKREK